MINQITTKTFLNPFSKKNYYDLLVDNTLLEEVILSKIKERITPGLVPTLLNWLSNKRERKVVWERVLPQIGKKSNLPLLMCSEDIDFWGTLIITEVERDEKFVYWKRFGLDDSDTVKPEEIGDNVKWFSGPKPMKFLIKEYQLILSKYKKYLDYEGNDVYPKKINEEVEIWELKDGYY
jgi:hypothetical protein